MEKAIYWIKELGLEKHPEGGWFKEIYRSDEKIEHNGLPERFDAARNISTSIYYLLEGNNKSNFHRIKSDELWHFYTGDSAVEILLIIDGQIERLLVGADFENGEHFQVIVPANIWFAAHLKNKNGYALTGCTVAPGFDFNDFELANREILLADFPGLKDEIIQFT